MPVFAKYFYSIKGSFDGEFSSSYKQDINC